MKRTYQMHIDAKEFKESHKEELMLVVDQIEQIVPMDSTVNGHIKSKKGLFEGRLLIQTKVGQYLARAKDRNPLALVAKLRSKAMRQIVNWREKRAAKKRYRERRRHLTSLAGPEMT